VGHFKRRFQVEWDIATNLFWYQKTRLITLPHDVKLQLYILSFRHKARVCDGRTDRLTDGRTYVLTKLLSQDRASIGASRGINDNCSLQISAKIKYFRIRIGCKFSTNLGLCSQNVSRICENLRKFSEILATTCKTTSTD